MTKVPDKKRERKDLFWLMVSGDSFRVQQLCCSGPEVRQNITVEGNGGGKLLIPQQLRSREGERN